jgi:hypothetical protein
MVGVVCADGSRFCLRVTADADVMLMWRHGPVTDSPVPQRVYVTDKAGQNIRARIDAGEPDTLVLH